MGKFRQFLTELFFRDMSEFSFPDDNFSKYQWIFTKLGVCIDLSVCSSVCQQFTIRSVSLQL